MLIFPDIGFDDRIQGKMKQNLFFANDASKINHRVCVSEIMLIFLDLGFEYRIQAKMKEI